MTDVTQQNYDEVPYPSAPKPATHPDRLATLATLYGMTPQPIENCRVLELGCSDGGNLIPMAATLPNSQFVGLDLSPRQIASGQSNVDFLGLKNVELHTMSIADVPESMGKFDYIACYGVYSWVAPHIQQRILEVTKQCLAPNGVAIISYNVFPGWHSHLLAREMMLYHTRRIDDLAERAKEARKFLKFVLKASEAIAGRSALAMDTTAYNIALKSEDAALDGRPDLYVAHEHLEPNNLPVYFYEFAERAQAAGLQYLAEANFFTMHLSNFPGFAAEEVQKQNPDIIEAEQYMDFMRNRSFRQTLLCHSDVALDRSLPSKNVRSLYVGSPMVPVSKENFNLRSETPEQFVAPNDVVMSVTSPLAKAVMMHLHETWPAWTAFEDLLPLAHYRLDPNWVPVQGAERARNDTQALSDMLMRFYIADIVELHARPQPYALELSEKPEAFALARHLAGYGPHVVSLRHDTVTLEDDVSHQLVKYLDGTRNRADLLALLERLVQEGVLVVHPAEGQPTGSANGAHSREVLEQALDRSMRQLARSGIIVR